MNNLQQITSPYRFLFLLVFSAALMVVDHRSDVFTPMRLLVSSLNLPFQILVGLPTEIRDGVKAYYPDDSLHARYTALQHEQLLLKAKLQRFDAIMAENERLANLLLVSRKAGHQALLAEVVEIGLDPFTHRAVLNRGVGSGVYLGQPVITPEGVLGQISGVGFSHSVVTLITDPSHGIPVQIQRSGLRTIVQGEGVSGWVGVPFLHAQVDIRTTDVLVTSGVGGRFPPGYKVAQVQEIITDANQAFLKVDATTFASIEHAGAVLLLWDDASQSAPSEATGG